MKDRMINIQWSFDFIKTQYLNKKNKDSYREDLYHSYLALFADKYYSSFSPFLLIGGADISSVQSKKDWFVRDGDLILAMFFEFALPEQFDDTFSLMIHVNSSYLVPEVWKEKVRFFEISSKVKFGKNNLPKKIFITGIDDILSFEDHFVSELKKIENSFTKKQLEEIEIYAYFPDKRSDLWETWEDSNIFKYSKRLFELVKLDVFFPKLESILNKNDFSDTMYFEINSGLFVHDGYLKHYFFSRGAGELLSTIDTVKFKEVSREDLSLYHEVIFYKFNETFQSTNQEIIDINSLNKHYSNCFKSKKLNESWETWLKSYLKKYIKQKSGI